MMVIKYGDFINENLDKSRKYLKDIILLNSLAKKYDLIETNDELKIKLANKEIMFPRLSDLNMGFETEIDGVKVGKKEFMRDLYMGKVPNDELRKYEREILSKVRTITATKVLNGREKTYVLERDNIGWMGNFTYFFLYENVSTEVLNTTYSRLIDNKEFLGNLPVMENGSVKRVPFDANFINSEVLNNHENLTDALDRVDVERAVKRVYDTLTPILKEEYKNASNNQMAKFRNIALAFDSFGNGDADKNKSIWDAFFGKMVVDNQPKLANGEPNPTYGKQVFRSTLRRFTTLDAFLDAANGQVMANSTETVELFMDNLTRAKALGKAGVEVIAHENNIVVLEVLSFKANKVMNSHTRHCIKDNIGDWNRYVGESCKQYYVYNLNLPLSDDMSTIGITVDSESRRLFSFIFNTIDTEIYIDNFVEYLKNLEQQYELSFEIKPLLVGPNPEEIIFKRKSRTASNDLTKITADIDIADVEKLLKEYNADPNYNDGLSIFNAVKVDRVDVVKLLIEYGGIVQGLTAVTHGSKMNIVSVVKSYEMAKILIDHGLRVNMKMINNIIQNDKENTVNLYRYIIDNLTGDLKTTILSTVLRSIIKNNRNEDDNANQKEIAEIIIKTLIRDFGLKIFDKDWGILVWAFIYNSKMILDIIDTNKIFSIVSSESWNDMKKFIDVSGVNPDIYENFETYYNKYNKGAEAK